MCLRSIFAPEISVLYYCTVIILTSDVDLPEGQKGSNNWYGYYAKKKVSYSGFLTKKFCEYCFFQEWLPPFLDQLNNLHWSQSFWKQIKKDINWSQNVCQCKIWHFFLLKQIEVSVKRKSGWGWETSLFFYLALFKQIDCMHSGLRRLYRWKYNILFNI